MIMYYEEGGTEVIVNKDIGTVDYKNGIMTVNSLNISSIDGNSLEFIFKPQSYDVVAIRNNILSIPTTMVSVSAVVDSAGTRYQFTSSRS